MKQFRKILKFELKNYLANKTFMGVTLFLMIAIMLVMFFPRLRDAFRSDSAAAPEDRGVIALGGQLAEQVQPAFADAFPDRDVAVFDGGAEAVRERVVSGEADCAFVIDSLTSYTYYVEDLSMYDGNTAVADAVLKTLYQAGAMIEGGFTPEAAEALLTVQIEHTVSSLGKDQMQNFFYTYIMIFALYMVILLYGQMVATNVGVEKSSRAMELLITSAKPVSMMFGKVLASCLAGLVQLVAVFGSALVFYKLNSGYWGDNLIIRSMFNMPVDLFLYMLLFFVLGFFIYAFLYGAIGSTSSKLEDVNTAVMPITFVFIIAFVVVMFSMGSGNVDTVLMKVCSFVPLTSPMAMFTRIAMSTVPVYEIVISVVILILSAVGIGVVSAKIYRVGVLLYGTRPKLGQLLKAIYKA